MTPEAPRAPLAAPDLSGNERADVRECLDTGWISSRGRFVPALEAAAAEALGAASDGRRIGSSGAASVFSFFGKNEIVTTGAPSSLREEDVDVVAGAVRRLVGA